MPRAPAAPSTAAGDFPPLGMSLRRLQRVVDNHRGGRQALRGLTTSQVKLRVFAPLTAATRQSLCEQLQAQGDPCVGVATWFVSHAWARPFLELLEALEHFFDGEAQGHDTIVWLDLVSVVQHPTCSRPARWWSHSLRAGIQSIGNLVAVMAPWEQPTVLSRTWCLFELHACCSGSNCRFEIALPEMQRRRLASDLATSFETFNSFVTSARSECSECSLAGDRDGVFAAIRDGEGFAAVDAVVRRVMMSWILRQLRVGLEGARASGEEEETVMWLNAMGKLLCDHCEYAEAVPLLQQAVALCKQQHAPGAASDVSSNLLGRLIRPCHLNLVRAHKGVGDYSSAAALEEGIVACRRMLQGRDAEATMDSMCSLACTYSSMRDFARSATVFDEALALQRRVLGEQHPSTIRCGVKFACVLLRAGRVAESQSLVAAVIAACACSEQALRSNAVLWAFVRAVVEFYAGQMEVEGLVAAVQAARDAIGSGDEADWMQLEYDAAVNQGR